MKINFDYDIKDIEFISGDIYKGKNYRCNYIRFKSPYKNSAPGSENIQIYNYRPKGEIRASSMVLHGLGSRNIKFLLWLGPSLASVGVNTTIIILPGNYTRVEDDSVSGKSYFYPEINTMYRFWEHAVVDILATLDFLKQEKLWMENNVFIGYCLGGMIGTIVNAITDDFSHSIYMTIGGHIPNIMYESPAVSFIPRMVDKGYKADFNLHDKEFLYKIYKEQYPLVKKMSLDQIMTDTSIHPLFRIDPLSYAHLLDVNKSTFIDAYFDGTLSKKSRKMLHKEIKGAKLRILPSTHVSWLPFSFLLGRYILHKVNIYDKESEKGLLKSDKDK